MLKKFGCGGGVCGPRLKKPGLWMRFCLSVGGRLWQMFALATLLLFGFILWKPCVYLLLVCFLQVVGLMVWLQRGRI